MVGCDIGDAALASVGQDRIEAAAARLPALRRIRERFARERPLDGLRIAARLPVTPPTANLLIALVAGGAEVALCAADPGSTDDAVAAALSGDHGVRTYAIAGEDEEAACRHLEAVLVHRPDLTMDAGAALLAELHRDGGRLLGRVLGGTEATARGAALLRAMASRGELRCPVVAVDGVDTDQALLDHARALEELAAHPGRLGRGVHEVPWR